MVNSRLTLGTLLDAARTTIAAVASLLLARLLKLPEFYWAPISAIVIIESTIDPRTLAWQRFAGTALGAALGAFDRYVFSEQRTGICIRNFPVRTSVRLASVSRRVPLCSDYGEPRFIDRAPASGVDRGLAPVCGSFGGNRGSTRHRGSVAQSHMMPFRLCPRDSLPSRAYRFFGGHLRRIAFDREDR